MPPAAPKPPADPIPDRAVHRPLWKYALVAGSFLVWVALLLVFYLLGRA